MVSCAWPAGLDSPAKEVFDVVEDQGGVIYGVYLCSDEVLAEGARHSSREVVDVELDFHRGVNGPDRSRCVRISRDRSLWSSAVLLCDHGGRSRIC